MRYLIAVFLISMVGLASAQQYNHVVKTNLLGYFAGQYMFGYEYMLNENMSVQLVPGFISRNSDQTRMDYDINSGTRYNQRYEQLKSGFIAIPEFRYYAAPDATGAPHGLFIAAFARILSLKYDLTDTGDPEYFDYGSSLDVYTIESANVSRIDERTVLGGGITIGYAYYTSSGAMVEAFMGPQFKNATSSRTYANFVSVEAGDDAFDAKFSDISLSGVENSGWGLRFGVNVGLGF